jgi:hypothetical protein
LGLEFILEQLKGKGLDLNPTCKIQLEDKKVYTPDELRMVIGIKDET